ncbi:hypothetical protein ACQ4PT_024894 [Festuca glaucescens]
MVIASGVIDRGHLSPFGGAPADSSSSFFSEDLVVPPERQVGFWKSESMVDPRGSKSVFASPLEKINPMGANPEGGLGRPRGQGFKGLDILRVSKLTGQGNGSTLPSISWGDMITAPGCRPGETTIAESASGNSKIMASGVHSQSADTLGFIYDGDEALGSMEEVEAQTIGDLLPTDDDLISGVVDGFDFAGLSINQDDADEDIFGTGGGMELESDDSINKGTKNLEGSLKCQFSGENYINKCPSRTLFIRNVNANIADSDLRALFQQYGDVHKLYACKDQGYVTVSYYDIRAAQNAMRALHSKPLGLMKLDVQFSFPKVNNYQIFPDVNVSDYIGNMCMLDVVLMLKIYKDMDRGIFSPVSLQFDRSPHGICTSGPQKLSSPIRIEPARQYNNQAAIIELGGSLGQGNFGRGMQMFHPHSLPECHNSICNSSKSMTSSGRSASFRGDGVDYSHPQKVGSSSLHGHSFDQNNEASGVTGVGSFPLHGQHYSWNNSNAFPQSPSSPMMWPNVQHPLRTHGGYLGVSPHTLNTGAYPIDQHHMGSAPNNGGGFGNVHPGSLGSVGFPGSPRLYPSDLSVFPPARGNYRETMFSLVSTAGFPSLRQMINGRNPMAQVSASYDATNDRMKTRKHDGNNVQPENKRQFELDIERIAKGEDSRTTLMIKNIPNKYNCKLLLAVIDENHRGTYDFVYLPIDFKNKCNVGYAFINMTDPQHIIPFYKTFNGKRWEKFNSEKVASLAYARIQGRSDLISHFRNSSLMNEDKWCRPILFHKDGPNAGDQEPFPVGNNIRPRTGRNRPLHSSDTRGDDASLSTSPNQENSNHRANTVEGEHSIFVH